MKRTVGIFAALVALTLGIESIQAQNETFTYSGMVTWRAGKVSARSNSHEMAGRPVAGAKVRLGPGNYTATTDANGRFRIAGIPRGSYTMHIKAREHSSMTRYVVVNENEVQNDLTLVWRNVRLGKANRNVQG